MRESKAKDNKVDESTIIAASAKVVAAGRVFLKNKRKKPRIRKERMEMKKSQDPSGVPVNLAKYRTWKPIIQISTVTLRKQMHSGTNFPN